MKSLLLKVMLCTIVFSLLTNQYSYGQSKEVKKIYKEAHFAFLDGNFHEAVDLFESIYDDYYENAKYNYELGISYLQIYSHPKDLYYLEKAVQLDPKVNRDLYYWLGKANHLNYNFEIALDFLNEYYNNMKMYQMNHKDEVYTLIQQVKFAISQRGVKLPYDYKIEAVKGKINTHYSDHSPIINMDGDFMMYTSKKPVKGEASVNDYGEYIEHIFETRKDDEGNWQTPKIVKIDTNFNQHLATMHFYDNETKLLLYKSTQRGDIYVSNKEGESWSIPKPYLNLNSSFYEADAYVGRGEKVNYRFVSSDRNSKDGLLDIFYTEKLENGKWSELKPIPGKINTEFDENAPFLSNDGKSLFFSSNGHNSMGGYDIFKSTVDTATGQWGEPVNMGHPLNTPNNDIYFYFGYDGWSGYSSSYRVGGKGEGDIYKITFIPNVFIRGNVYEEDSKELLHGIEIHFVSYHNDTLRSEYDFIEIDGTAHEYEELDVVEVDNNPSYRVNTLSDRDYAVFFIKDGDTLDVKPYHVPLLKEGDNIHFRKDFVINDKYDLDKSFGSPESLLAGYKSERLERERIEREELLLAKIRENEIRMANELAAKELALKEAEEAAKQEASELALNTMSGSSEQEITETTTTVIEPDGYDNPLTEEGVENTTEELLAENSTITTTDPEENNSSLKENNSSEELADNSSTEPEEKINPLMKEGFDYSSMKTNSYDQKYSKPKKPEQEIEDLNISNLTINEDFDNTSPEINENANLEDYETSRKKSSVTEKYIEENNYVSVNTKIPNVYFQFNKYSIDNKDLLRLNALARQINHGDMILTIIGHADEIGSHRYNDALSKRRAKKVYDYLVSINVPAEKLIIKSEGSKNPLVSNDDETDGREINRRVEFNMLVPQQSMALR